MTTINESKKRVIGRLAANWEGVIQIDVNDLEENYVGDIEIRAKDFKDLVEDYFEKMDSDGFSGDEDLDYENWKDIDNRIYEAVSSKDEFRYYALISPERTALDRAEEKKNKEED